MVKTGITKDRRLSILLLLVPATISFAFVPSARAQRQPPHPSSCARQQQQSAATTTTASSSSSSSSSCDREGGVDAMSVPRWFQREISITAPSRGCHLITPQVNRAIKDDVAGIRIGMANIFIQHTSASLTINENADPDVLR
jgi:hypothetical protein